MLASDLVEVLCAAHLASLVEGPFNERGGIMVVGPPGVLKSTFVSTLDHHYQDAIMMSDVNVKSLVRMRDAIASGKVNTLVLPELAKVYERADVTSMNVEGTLRALTAEGFSAASFEDSRVNRLQARAVVIAALTPSLVETHFSAWEESGFNRRFLWCLIRLSDPTALERAAVNWKRIDFRIRHVPLAPLGSKIPNLTEHAERKRLAVLVKYQPGGDHAIQIQLMVRILAVLRWWYNETGDRRDPMQTVEAFAVSLGRAGAELELEEPSKPNLKAEQKRVAHSAASTLAHRRWNKRKKPIRRKGLKHGQR